MGRDWEVAGEIVAAGGARKFGAAWGVIDAETLGIVGDVCTGASVEAGFCTGCDESAAQGEGNCAWVAGHILKERVVGVIYIGIGL